MLSQKICISCGNRKGVRLSSTHPVKNSEFNYNNNLIVIVLNSPPIMERNNWTRLFAVLVMPIAISGVFLAFKAIKWKNRRLNNSRSDKSFSVYEDKMQIAIENDSKVVTWNSLGLEQALVIVMVGLPARGKSYIVKMIIRYLKWIGYECEVFNVGSHRRSVGMAAATSNFFDSNNKEAQALRERMAMEVLDDMYAWLHEDGEGAQKRVAIFDATNTTKARRLALIQRARTENVFLLFVESICDDKQVLERNYQLKLQNDDYRNMDPEKALSDFKERVRAYEKVYEV
jgi:predicted kinase